MGGDLSGVVHEHLSVLLSDGDEEPRERIEENWSKLRSEGSWWKKESLTGTDCGARATRQEWREGGGAGELELALVAFELLQGSGELKRTSY
jgi:hypothetical protein